MPRTYKEQPAQLHLDNTPMLGPLGIDVFVTLLNTVTPIAQAVCESFYKNIRDHATTAISCIRLWLALGREHRRRHPSRE